MKNTIITWKKNNYYSAEMSCGEYTITSNVQDDTAFKPTEMILASLGTCGGLFLKPVLAEKDIKWESLKISVSGEKATPPQLFKTINMHYEIEADVNTDVLEEALEESHRRCLIMNTLNPNIDVKTTFEIK